MLFFFFLKLNFPVYASPTLIFKLQLLPEGLMLTEAATIILSCFKCGFSLMAQELMLFFPKHTVLLRGELEVSASSVFLTVQHMGSIYLMCACWFRL